MVQSSSYAIGVGIGGRGWCRNIAPEALKVLMHEIFKKMGALLSPAGCIVKTSMHPWGQTRNHTLEDTEIDCGCVVVACSSLMHTLLRLDWKNQKKLKLMTSAKTESKQCNMNKVAASLHHNGSIRCREAILMEFDIPVCQRVLELQSLPRSGYPPQRLPSEPCCSNEILYILWKKVAN